MSTKISPVGGLFSSLHERDGGEVRIEDDMILGADSAGFDIEDQRNVARMEW